MGVGHRRAKLRTLLAGHDRISLNWYVLHTRPPAPIVSGTAMSAPLLSVLVDVIVVVPVRDANSLTVDGTNCRVSFFMQRLKEG